MRPLVLLITRNFPPLLGGMEKVNQHILEACQQDWCIALCGPEGCAEFTGPETEVSQHRVKPLWAFLIGTLWDALRLANRHRPQFVLAGSGLTAPIAWLVARCSGSSAVVYLHGLDVVVPSRVYQWLWLPIIRRCDMALANSASTKQLAMARGVASERLHVLHPGTELPVLNPAAASVFRYQQQLQHRPLLLSVGRLTQRKGLVEFVTKALPAIVKQYPDVMLLVIGENATDALQSRAGSERERIASAARSVGVEKNLRLLGRCDEQTLSAAYQASDVHIFPVLALPGDVEGFGMVSLEAAAHGLPTVAFDVGGVPDAVKDGSTGSLVASGNYEALANDVILQLARAHDASVVNACREFAAGKTWPIFSEQLRGLLRALCR